MVDCKFCENQNISFTCEKCNSSFCIHHMATTESWLCKKHELHYSKASAAEKFYKCTVIENSKCPECQSLLRLERLSSGQYYLECIDETCSWNSYSKSPGLFFPTKEQLAREATKYNLIQGYRLNLCRRTLKRIIGKDICPNCFLEFLKISPITNFSTIIESFKINAQQMVKLINQYIDEDRIYGIVDQKNQIFYYISYEFREKILSKIQNEGIIKVPDLAVMLDMSSEAAIKVIYKLLSQFQIKGSFSQTKQFYYSQKYIMDHLVEEINKKGRISLSKLSKVFDIPTELAKSFCVNLMRLNTINGFFADRGNEIITSDKIYKEIKAYSKEVGLFELSNLAKKLKIAVELARKSLHELIKSGKVK